MSRDRPPFYIHADDPPAKQEILRAAMKLFSGQGLAATSIRDIAAESGYTNPALYKHFASKQDLALQLFETCHRHLWGHCHRALTSGPTFEHKLQAYVGAWLELLEAYPEVVAFVSDSARVLWPRSGRTVRRQTIIGLARSLVLEAPRFRQGGATVNPDVAAASVQGTLSEVARMLQIGVLDGPATRWQGDLVTLLRRCVS